MALQKQTLDLSFSQGVDTKSDPFRVQPGKFLNLQNSIFDKIGRLTKRNGFGPLTPLVDSSSTFLTTFQGNLTAVGDTLQAYSNPTNQWVTKGTFQPMNVQTLPLIRSNLNQIQADSVVSSNGLVLTAYTNHNGGTTTYSYVIADAVTGQNIVAPTLIPSTGGGTVTGSPRVFILGNYFIVLFTNVISATSHLQYMAISMNNPTIVTAPVDVASAYVSSPGLSFDGVVQGNKLFIAYNSVTGGQNVSLTFITTLLGNPGRLVTFTGQKATLMSVTADATNPSAPIIYASYYDSSSQTGHVLAVDQSLNTILAPTQYVSATSIQNVTSAAINGAITIYAEVINTYGYDSSIRTDYINTTKVTQSGTVGSTSVLIRSLGLASKAFIINDTAYFVGIYSELPGYNQGLSAGSTLNNNQPTYFVINQYGGAVTKFAYSNGGSYYTLGLPSALVSGLEVSFSYFYQDSIQSVNKTTGSTVSAGIFAQLGINLATITFESRGTASEIGGTLNLGAGFLWAYDGYSLVEQGFHVWPDFVEATTSTSGGLMTAQQYFYQVTYEWPDNQGNINRSAPSIPVQVNTTGSTSSVTLDIPTLRITYKTANAVKIVIYRWSAAQQNYYQITSIQSPTLNNPAVDYITYTDTLADTAIVGNNLIYTTGGVLEDIAGPATSNTALFNNRLWLIDAEDRNLLWYSKQVIEATPVEMSDLLTLYVAPTTSAQTTTGPMTALSPMDDKLVIFKQNAVGYINGIGPDNTGSNNQYSDFVLINSVVGCTNQASIVLMPQGLMFQSNQGIWVLGRDLSTNYIGAPVESFTQGATVESAINIPMTTQVRFTLDSGITLMYDYFYQQWGTFVNIPADSSTVYENLHTYLNSDGQVFQESPGLYLDNSSPVLMSFTTSWLSLAGVQGFERFYQFYLLGQTLSPFKLNVQIGYDFNSSATQSTIIAPTRYGNNWGSDPLWGDSSPWGGANNIFEERVFPDRQKCESFQLTITEIFDNSIGLIAGAGLTLSGLNIVAGIKRGFRTQSSAKSF